MMSGRDEQRIQETRGFVEREAFERRVVGRGCTRRRKTIIRVLIVLLIVVMFGSVLTLPKFDNGLAQATVIETITEPYVVVTGEFDVVDIYEYGEFGSHGYGAEYNNHIAHVNQSSLKYNITNMIILPRNGETFSQLRIYIIQNGSSIAMKQINIDWGEVYTFVYSEIEFEILLVDPN